MTTCVALLETVPSKRVEHIQFGLLNPEHVKKQSVVEVTKSTLYHRQLPAYNGLNDLRMGTCDRRVSCGTCKNDVLNCVGHFGHIELAAPLYHISMMHTLIKVLRCVCFFCSKLLVNLDEDTRIHGERMDALDAKDRLNYVVSLCKTRHKCAHCGGPQPKYVQQRTSVAIKTEFRPKDAKEFESEEERAYVELPFTAAQARSILHCISDEDVALLGINPKYARPEWMVLTVLPVPPPISRPSIMATDGSRARGQDDVTVKLQDIVKANRVVANMLQQYGMRGDEIMRAYPPPLLAAIDALQTHLAQFMHYDCKVGAAASTAPPRANRPLRLIPARLKGKKGRFRGTLGGKRVDYSARTVVSPAPNYDIDEVGVPRIIAHHLTFPERVTAWNLNELAARVKRGPAHADGAVAVVLPDGSLIDLSLCEERETLQLQPGFIVERFLKDGDWVLFNRQPSLHRMSIMAHRVKVIDDKTFRLPICDTTPYNADFDGDEMNLHVLRTYEAVAEAKELMSVSTQMISPQSNKPIIGLVQDSLVAVYLLTLKDTFLTRAQLMQMVMPVHYPLFDKLPPPCILKPTPLWSGKQLFSLLFPPFSLDVTLPSGVADGIDKSPQGHMDFLERRVIVQNGELLAGALCKKTMGTSPGGIIHVLVKDCGNTIAANFISDAQRLLVEFMLHRGFSVGVGDCLMPGATHAKVVASIHRSLAYADRVLHTADTDAAVLESCVTRVMTGVLTRVGALVQEDLPRSNQVHIMVTSGAKGSSVNIAQILGCVGQQSVEGGRIAPDIFGRTLPCYRPGQRTVESRGFVANSYGTGLTAQEYFFHAMGGREGLVDTAVKTASTGYIQRRLVKAEEGLQVRYDRTVRNTKDQVVQFAYGGDCFDAVYVEKQTLRTFTMSDAAVRSHYTFTQAQLVEATGCVDAQVEWAAWEAALTHEVQTLCADRDVLRAAKAHLAHAPTSHIFVTVTPVRALQQAVRKFELTPLSASPLTHPSMVTRVLEAAYSQIRSFHASSPTITFVTIAYLRTVLSLRTVVVERRLHSDALCWVADLMVRVYRNSLVSPGEMVGTLGAASIGEPCTQMTLNTFHTAGVAEKAVTLGVPRLKELIDTTRDIRTPSLTVFFTGGYEAHENMARLYGVSLEHTVLHQVVRTSGVELDPDPWVTTIAADAPVVDAYRALHYEPGDADTYVRWVIRFVLDREVLARKNLTVTHVAQALQTYLGDTVQLMRSEVNMMHWVVRVRVKDVSGLLSELDGDVDDVERELLKQAAVKTVHDFLLDNVAIGGVPGVKRCMVRQQEQVKVVRETGELVHSKEWMADTDGTNLRCVLTLPFVNKRKTISNDIHEVLDVLGIEAAQQVLVEELRAVLSFDGSYVNERHLQLLVDVMCLSGTLTAMTRHSMHKLGGSTYHHASFEETQDVLIQAAAFGTYDHVTGVTENLMMGQLMPGGTGACDVITLPQAAAPVAAVVQPLQVAVEPQTKRTVAPLFASAPTSTVQPLHVKPLVAPKVVERAPVQPPSKVAPPARPAVTTRPGPRVTKAFVPLSPQQRATSFVPLSPTPLSIDSFFE